MSDDHTHGDDDDDLQGGSALRYDDGHFFSFLQDDYVLPVPSHPPELDRLELIHAILRETIGLVPPQVDALLSGGDRRILDVGCGTGQWALEVAQAYPTCQIVGVDLVDTPLATPPLNCHFRIHDIIRGLPCEDDSIDVVRTAGVLLGIHDYPALLTECARVLRPGGYLLLREIEYAAAFLDGADPGERAPAVATATFRNALVERGLNHWGGYGLDDLAAGVRGIDIVAAQRHSVPLGMWSTDPTLRRHGAMSRQILRLLADSTRVMFHDHGVAEPEALRDAALAEVDAGRDGLVWVYDFVLARKV
ncbi:hypothetical protein Q5752_002089 [Cryptotrichosporon argae]